MIWLWLLACGTSDPAPPPPEPVEEAPAASTQVPSPQPPRRIEVVLEVTEVQPCNGAICVAGTLKSPDVWAGQRLEVPVTGAEEVLDDLHPGRKLCVRLDEVPSFSPPPIRNRVAPLPLEKLRACERDAFGRPR